MGRVGSSDASRLYFWREDKMLRKLMAICGLATAAPHVAPVPFARVDDSVQRRRTPEEVKARKKAYKRRKAAKAARRRNRK